MRRLFLALGLCLASGALLSCEHSPDMSGVDASDVPPAPDLAAGSPDLGGAAALVPCLDRPTELPRPPAGTLPCDLIPPSF